MFPTFPPSLHFTYSPPQPTHAQCLTYGVNIRTSNNSRVGKRKWNWVLRGPPENTQWELHTHKRRNNTDLIRGFSAPLSPAARDTFRRFCTVRRKFCSSAFTNFISSLAQRHECSVPVRSHSVGPAGVSSSRERLTQLRVLIHTSPARLLI